MEILDETPEEIIQGPNPKKKVVGALIIGLTLLTIVIIMLMVALGGSGKNNTYAFFIDEKKVETSQEFVFESSTVAYVGIEELAKKLVNYEYNNGGYLEHSEKTDKCYLQHDKNIVGFQDGTEVIYKTVEDSLLDYQEYSLKNIIMSNNNKLYIAADDLANGFNLVTQVDKEKKEIHIYTSTYLNTLYNKKLVEPGTYDGVDIEEENDKVFSYEMIIVKKAEKYGVIDTQGNTLIGTKYNGLKFVEYEKSFIAEDYNGRFGVLTNDGEEKIPFKYDSISVINYSPLLYLVEKNEKFGIVDKTGKNMAAIEYDGFGCVGDETKDQNSVLVIPNILDGVSGIVYELNEKYGIINLGTGEIVLEGDTMVDSIYSKTEDGIEKYYIDIETIFEHDLEDYLERVQDVIFKNKT